MDDQVLGETQDQAPGNADSAMWLLRLYVAGDTPRSVSAIANLKQICEQHLAGRYQIEVIDLLKNPELASDDQILAIPTVVRKAPAPEKKVIGDLSNNERALAGLNIISTAVS